MPAYMIVTAKIDGENREEFINGYGMQAAKLVEQFGGRYVLRGPGAELLEGNFGDGAGMVISEWKDKDAVYTFWNSPEYAAAKKLRDGLADCQVLVIEAPSITGDS